jgi:hypothetical protein
MKTIEYPLDNTGGLRDIYAIPVSAYRQTGYTASGGRMLELHNTDDVIHIPCSPSRFDFSEDRRESDSGDQYDIVISGFICGITEHNDEIIERLRSDAWIVMTKDIDGACKLSGVNGVKLVFACKTSAGDSRASLKGTAFEFKCTDAYPAVALAGHPF